MASCRPRRSPRQSRSTGSIPRSPRRGRGEGARPENNEKRRPQLPAIEVKVPDIGDFKDVPVIEVLVKPGDAVKKDDSLITLESDKATMEVPAPSSGTVKDIRVKVGDKVSEGVAILTMEGAGEGKPAPTPAATKAESPAPKAPAAAAPARQ